VARLNAGLDAIEQVIGAAPNAASRACRKQVAQAGRKVHAVRTQVTAAGRQNCLPTAERVDRLKAAVRQLAASVKALRKGLCSR
jgi:hypothetical protein